MRNISVIKKNIGKPCIYVKMLTRQRQIAFVGVVQYFTGSLLMLLQKKNNIDLLFYTNFLNSTDVRQHLQCSNRIVTNLKYVSGLPVHIKNQVNFTVNASKSRAFSTKCSLPSEEVIFQYITAYKKQVESLMQSLEVNEAIKCKVVLEIVRNALESEMPIELLKKLFKARTESKFTFSSGDIFLQIQI